MKPSSDKSWHLCSAAVFIVCVVAAASAWTPKRAGAQERERGDVEDPDSLPELPSTHGAGEGRAEFVSVVARCAGPHGHGFLFRLGQRWGFDSCSASTAEILEVAGAGPELARRHDMVSVLRERRLCDIEAIEFRREVLNAGPGVLGEGWTAWDRAGAAVEAANGIIDCGQADESVEARLHELVRPALDVHAIVAMTLLCELNSDNDSDRPHVEGAMEALIGYPGDWSAIAIMLGVCDLGQPGDEFLARIARSEVGRRRRWALYAVSRRGDASLLPIVYDLLLDPDPEVRAHAHRVFDELGGPLSQQPDPEDLVCEPPDLEFTPVDEQPR